ncbi:LOW QUALITY PROTEIN: 3'(2'),5'-bisphosphate nucleotidase 1-like [Liolophura sinensis]|uniref:LOW QUALITY PROTEIN: 3'(2'),5'-bisphosphate nucleotidase 1-like n=1 Tax=Liolophura sinensis TaxID=3198878 RepID=UPI0031589C35
MAATSAFPLLMRIVSASVAASAKAAKVVRSVMKKGDLGIVEKGKNDLQTEADRAAQRCIMASLQKHFPKVVIIGGGGMQLDPNEKVDQDIESLKLDDVSLQRVCPENLTDVRDEDVVIWVDPLDGTAEYTQGLLDHVTVLIGIAVKGKAQAGVICQPYYNYQLNIEEKLGRVIWGVIGLGAFGFERNNPPEGKNIITTTRSHSNPIVTEAVEACQPTEVLRVGGAGHKVLLLIEGKANAYVFASPGCKKWDTCAPEAVLHAIGGTLTDMHGNQIMYHKGVEKRNLGGVLATPPPASSHQWYAQRIPQRVKDALPLNK